jgi:5-(carboxyamino)imidazole ribonucleotide synthase
VKEPGRTTRRPHPDRVAAASGPILPGAVLGILGGGQLGRMFALAARRLGYRVHVLTEVPDSPAGQVADLEVAADPHDAAAVSSFARDVAVVTFEWENVPAEAAEVAADNAVVRPGPQALRVSQNRIREKTFLHETGIPVTPFAAVRSPAELGAARSIGFPAVLKTAEWGYDGKGQALVRDAADLESAWDAIDRRQAILERFVDFDHELSVVAVRGPDGAFAAYAPFENTHRDHILDVSVSPAEVPPAVGAQAVEIALTVMEKLDFVGVLCIELFWTREGDLLANEIAPRPHNSGHLTIDAHLTSQFEQQVRAVCGLPLGSTHQRTPAAMANLLGDLWAHGVPDWTRVLAQPEVALHLYGKTEARAGRKMGHLTALASSPDLARDRVLAARRLLAGD